MDSRNILFNIESKKSTTENGQQSNQTTAPIEHEYDDNNCPDCHIALIRLGSCFSCPICGFGGCG